jgi:hypothetical protein
MWLDQEINRELVAAIEDRLRPAAALEIEDVQEPHLGQDNIVWQGLDKPLL